MEDIQRPEVPAAPAVTAPQENGKAPEVKKEPAQVEALIVPAQVMGLIYTYLRKRPHEEVDELIALIKNNIKPIYKEDK